MTIETQDPYQDGKHPPTSMAEAIRADLANARRGLTGIVRSARTGLREGEQTARELWANRRENLDKFIALAKDARSRAAKRVAEEKV